MDLNSGFHAFDENTAGFSTYVLFSVLFRRRSVVFPFFHPVLLYTVTYSCPTKPGALKFLAECMQRFFALILAHFWIAAMRASWRYTEYAASPQLDSNCDSWHDSRGIQ